jgi:hypothetical protein
MKLAENAQQSPEFAERLQRLKALSEKRDALVRRVRQYNTVQNQLQPLKTESIQPTLVARDGPIAEELTKAKSLGIRLTGRVARLKHPRRKTTRYKSPMAKPGQPDQINIIDQELARQHWA